MQTGGSKVRIEYDDAITRMFLIAGIVWGAVGMAAGVFVASQLAFMADRGQVAAALEVAS